MNRASRLCHATRAASRQRMHVQLSALFLLHFSPRPSPLLPPLSPRLRWTPWRLCLQLHRARPVHRLIPCFFLSNCPAHSQSYVPRVLSAIACIPALAVTPLSHRRTHARPVRITPILFLSGPREAPGRAPRVPPCLVSSFQVPVYYHSSLSPSVHLRLLLSRFRVTQCASSLFSLPLLSRAALRTVDAHVPVSRLPLDSPSPSCPPPSHTSPFS